MNRFTGFALFVMAFLALYGAMILLGNVIPCLQKNDCHFTFDAHDPW